MRVGLLYGALGAAGCAADAPAGGAPSATPGADAGPTGPSAGAPSTLWGEQCAACHGAGGEGSVAPAVAGWSRGRAVLVDRITQTMPLGDPAACGAPCAATLADWILALPTPARCADERYHPTRQLRLLTRAEYAQTLSDILGLDAEAPCGQHTFRFDGTTDNPSTVVVAGSFNGWAARVEDGAWPLTREGDRWSLVRDLPNGRHLYKFVLDGADWRADPASPETEPDGFGGANSVLVVDCAAAAGPPDLAALVADLPVESRPEDYPFDNAAEAGLVSAAHLDGYLAAAARLAAYLLADPAARLGCRPAEAGCPDRVLRDLGARLFRRPLAAEETAAFAGLVAAAPDPATGLQVALRVLLASPSFLYRAELGAPQADGAHRLTGPELATALAYLFWRTTPDDALAAAGAAGALDTPAGRRAAAARLLADPRARPVVSTFVEQWLGLGPVREATKRPEVHPAYDAALRASLLAETRAFAAHVVFDGTGRFDELLTADYTFADADLAALYDLPAPAEPGLSRVPYRHGRRAGVLGHGSVLGRYAHSDQSSPVLRGVFVRERLLCQTFGAPPANAGGVPDVDPRATTRERFRQHADDPACRSCHRYIDELGFGLERFDAAGAFREAENGQPIEAGGRVEDLEGFGVGTEQSFASLPELAGLLAGSRAAPRCFVTQLWRFAYGRLDRPEDACAIDRLTDAFVAADLDVQALMLDLVASPDFALREAP